MKIGMELPGYWPDSSKHINNLFPEMMESIRLADQIGLDAFSIGEHHFQDYNVTPSPISLAVHVAAITKRQRIALAVMLLPLHDITRLAGEITMADHLTNGRLDVGVGRGGFYEAIRMGIPSDYETSRAIFEDRLSALHLLLENKDVSVDTQYTKFKDVTIMPPPLQTPYPPIWQAAMRPESAFHIAKQGYHLHTGQLRNPMSFVHETMQAFREGAAQSNGRQGRLKISMLQWVYIAKDEADRREKVEMAYNKHRKFMGLLNNLSVVKGGIVPPVDIEGDAEHYAKTLLIGSKEYVQERILEFKELGFDDFIMKLHIGPDHRDLMESLDRFGQHVLPLVRKGDEDLGDAAA